MSNILWTDRHTVGCFHQEGGRRAHEKVGRGTEGFSRTKIMQQPR